MDNENPFALRVRALFNEATALDNSVYREEYDNAESMILEVFHICARTPHLFDKITKVVEEIMANKPD